MKEVNHPVLLGVEVPEPEPDAEFLQMVFASGTFIPVFMPDGTGGLQAVGNAQIPIETHASSLDAEGVDKLIEVLQQHRDKLKRKSTSPLVVANSLAGVDQAAKQVAKFRGQ